jgi:hypothetical protein
MDHINQIVGTNNPTVEFLCALLKNDLDEKTFSCAFMMLTLDAFIAPNGYGSASTAYYHALVDLDFVPLFDWCSFSLKWLLMSIDKYRSRLLQGIQSEIGGCKLILVVCSYLY